MKALRNLGTIVEQVRTAVGYKLFLDNQLFTASRAADEIMAQAAERGDLDPRTVRALCAHFQDLDAGIGSIPSVVRKPPTPEFTAYCGKIFQSLYR
jgi:hypothetical protein